MVGREKIIITETVVLYLDELVQILYKENYFGFIESAEAYVSKIYLFIYENLIIAKHFKSPVELENLGTSYISYQAAKRTTWYIFFEKRKNKYIITHILNNHCAEARFLLKDV